MKPIYEKSAITLEIETKLLQLDGEKKQRIISAAFDEFTKGYKNATTDNIVKRAGISKGSLFHYCKTKKNLFIYLVDTAMDMILSEFFTKGDLKESDALKRIQEMILTEMKLVSKFPSIIKFLTELYIGDNGEATEYVDEKMGLITVDYMGMALGGVDLSLFRDDIDHAEALKVIMFAFRGYAESEADRMKATGDKELHYDKYNEEVSKMNEIFRRCFYK